MSKKVLVWLPIGILVAVIVTAIPVVSCSNNAQPIMAGLTAALVWVTAFYAYATYYLASLTEKTSKIALNAEFSAAAPVIAIRVNKTSGTMVISGGKNISGTEYWLDLTNIGKGPALNLRCWIEETNYTQFRNRDYAYCATAIAVSASVQGIVSVPILNYQLGVGYIRVQYESIFEVTYESCLIYSTNAAPELKYGKAAEKIVI